MPKAEHSLLTGSTSPPLRAARAGLSCWPVASAYAAAAMEVMGFVGLVLQQHRPRGMADSEAVTSCADRVSHCTFNRCSSPGNKRSAAGADTEDHAQS